MKKLLVAAIVPISFSAIYTSPATAGMGDDPLLTKVMSEFEYLPNAGDGALEWDIDAWAGYDLAKVWIKTSGEVAKPHSREHQLDELTTASATEVENANIELVYSRAVHTTWDQQFGVRHDIKPDSDGITRNWVSYGYIGTAPYFVEVDARVFVGEKSSTQLVIELEREFMLTQEWVLTPELNIVANGRTNPQFGEGSGLSEVEFSLRLGYEAKGNRKFQPFIGLVGHKKFGGSKRFEQAEGNTSSDLHAMLGIHSWF